MGSKDLNDLLPIGTPIPKGYLSLMLTGPDRPTNQHFEISSELDQPFIECRIWCLAAAYLLDAAICWFMIVNKLRYTCLTKLLKHPGRSQAF